MNRDTWKSQVIISVQGSKKLNQMRNGVIYAIFREPSITFLETNFSRMNFHQNSIISGGTFFWKKKTTIVSEFSSKLNFRRINFLKNSISRASIFFVTQFWESCLKKKKTASHEWIFFETYFFGKSFFESLGFNKPVPFALKWVVLKIVKILLGKHIFWKSNVRWTNF